MKQTLIFAIEPTTSNTLKLTSWLEFHKDSTLMSHGLFEDMDELIMSVTDRLDRLTHAGVNVKLSSK